jgi:hypothetical protein
MSYMPQPGTIAARVMALLQRQPAGATLSSAEIADELDVQASDLCSVMAPARKSGAVVAAFDNTTRHILRWSLGNGQALPPPHDFDPEEDDKILRGMKPCKFPDKMATASLAEAALRNAAMTKAAVDQATMATATQAKAALTTAPGSADHAPSAKRPYTRRAPLAPSRALASPAPADRANQFRAGLFTDGRMLISRDGQAIYLEPPDVSQLFKLLQPFHAWAMQGSATP